MASKNDKGQPDLASRLLALYASNQRSVGQFNPANGQVHTLYRGPTYDDWAIHLNGKTGLGCVPILDDAKCGWAAIDIDNHGQDDDIPIAPIDKKITAEKLPLIACRSKSGGVHCYLFLKKPVSAYRVRGLMAHWAEILGHGGSEIFPKQSILRDSKDGGKQLGNWINLPYLGSDNTIRYAFQHGKKLTTEEFVDAAEKIRASDEDLTSRVLIEHPEAPPCIQQIMMKGVDSGHRNEALYNATVYLRKAFPDEFEGKAALLNSSMFVKPLAKAELTRTINSAGRPDYSYRCGEEPIRSCCDREECLKRKFGITPLEADSLSNLADLPAFSGLAKYLSEPVRWEINIDGKVVTNVGTEQLLEWRFMRTIIAEKLTKVVPMIKNAEWERILQPLMSSARIIEAPDDASVPGVIRDRLREFAAKTDLTNRGKNKEDRRALLRGLPVVQYHEGERCVMFRGQDFINYLKRTKSEELKGINLWFAVKDLGIRHAKLRIGSDHNINLWMIPVKELLTDVPAPVKFESDL